MNTASILVVNYTSDISGSSIALARLLKAAKHVYKIKIAASPGSYINSFSEKSGLPFKEIEIPKLKNLNPLLLSRYLLQTRSFKKKIKSEIKEFKPDVILVNCLPNIAITYCFKPGKGPKLVWWVHELELNPLWVKKILMARVIKWASHVFGVSKPVLEMLGEGTDRSLLSNIIPKGGMNPENIFENNQLKILWVGTISPRKGFHRLVEIIRLIKQSGYAIQLEVVGSLLPQYEKYYQQFKAQIEKENSESQFLLNVDPDDVPYATHKILIQTSSLPESFSLPVAEAMSHGMLVFSPISGGMADYCKHLVNMVSYNNISEIPEHLKKIKEDEALLAKLQGGALLTSKKYSVNSALESFNKTINQIIGQ